MRISWWTLALQAANFLVLVWLLQRFLYRPVQAVLEKRRAEVDRAMANAASAQRAGEVLRGDLEAQRASIESERQEAVERAHAEAEVQRAALLERARREADEARAAARERIEREREDAAKAIQDRAARFSVDIASRLLTSLGLQRDEPFLEQAIRSLRSLAPNQRSSLAPMPADGIRIITASPLDDEQQRRCREELSALFDRGLEFEFAHDPALIAGVEIHFSHTVLRHNWREALSRILEEITRDGDATRRT
jgi:F0F1-type ATP synthase membrane subunit b/b'